MAKPSETREQAAPARQRPPRQLSPGTVLVAVVFLLLVAGYLANALWNLLHLSHYDSSHQLAAVTLPAPFVTVTVPLWLELASAAAFLLLVVLAVLTLRASSRPARRAASLSPSHPVIPVAPAAAIPTAPANTPGGPSNQPSYIPAPAPSLTPTIFTPRVFVSHSSKDGAFGQRLVADLRAALGGSEFVWYDAAPDPERDDRGGLTVGDPFPSDIIAHLARSNVFVILLSPDAVASRWVDFEIAQAVDRYLSPAREIAVILPILVRRTPLPDLLRIFQFVDLAPEQDETAPSNAWEARYPAARAELLRQIRSGESRRSAREGEPPFDDNLIPVPDHFVGREDDLTWALARVQPGGIAAVTAFNGLGGIGKTSLAAVVVREVMRERRFPEGIAVVDCRDQTEPALILRRVLGRFDPRREEPAEDTPLTRLQELAARALAGRRALVVLDNVEPDWPVELAIQPLRAAGVGVLLTSRQELPLAVVPVEASRQLQVLSPEDALELFAQTSGYANADALTPSDRAAAARIVAALGYHTLAVKLAAGYTAQQRRPLPTYADALEADPRRGLILRNGQEAVNSVLSTSYLALPEPLRQVFASLGLFATLEMGRQAALAAAVAILNTDNTDHDDHAFAAEQAIEQLVARRLLDTAPLEGIADEGDRERLRLHPLVRAFAAEQVTRWSDEDRQRVSRAIAAWYADYANTMPDPARAADEQNIAGALEALLATPPQVAIDALIARLCNGMMNYWRDRSHTAARIRYLPLGLEAAQREANRTGERDDRLRQARLQNALAELAQHLGDLNRATTLFQQSLAIMRAVQDRRGEGVVLSNLGSVAQQRGQLEQAEDYFQQSLAIRRAVQDRRGEGVVLSNLGQVAQARGQLAQAEDYYRQGLHVLHDVEDAANIAAAASLLGLLLFEHQGKSDEGCQLLQEATAIYHQMGLEDDAQAMQELARSLGCEA